MPVMAYSVALETVLRWRGQIGVLYRETLGGKLYLSSLWVFLRDKRFSVVSSRALKAVLLELYHNWYNMLCRASLQSRHHYADIRTPSVQVLETLVIGVNHGDYDYKALSYSKNIYLYQIYIVSRPVRSCREIRGPTNSLSAHMDTTSSNDVVDTWSTGVLRCDSTLQSWTIAKAFYRHVAWRTLCYHTK